jgi:hypothetical protein
VSDEWFQEVYFGAEPEFRSLGRLSAAETSIRNWIQKNTPEAKQNRQLDDHQALTAASAGALDAALRSSAAKANIIRAKIEAIENPGNP